HFIPGKATLVGLQFPLCRGPLELTEWIETLEFKAAIVAKKLMQTGQLKHHHGIVVAALNARTLTSRAPHASYLLRIQGIAGQLAGGAEARRTGPGTGKEIS